MSMTNDSAEGSRKILPLGGQILMRHRVYVLAAGIFLATCVLIPGFLNGPSIRALLVLTSILGIASIGQTVVTIVGGIDLSIPAMMSLANVMLAELTGSGWGFASVACLIVVAAVLVGIANGLATHYLRAPSLVVTLAVGSLIAGITLALNVGSAGGLIPKWITYCVSTNATTFGIPIPPVVSIWVVISIGGVVLQRRSLTFRRLYATGVNPIAARLALVSVPILTVVAFVVSGLSAALGGMFLGGFTGGANVEVGQPYLFLTIAAVVVGGTSLMGGRGGLGNTLAGALVICNLTTLLLGLGVDTNVQQILLGVLIVLLVALYGREQHVSERI
jgi:ribose transport system permease protein